MSLGLKKDNELASVKKNLGFKGKTRYKLYRNDLFISEINLGVAVALPITLVILIAVGSFILILLW